MLDSDPRTEEGRGIVVAGVVVTVLVGDMTAIDDTVMLRAVYLCKGRVEKSAHEPKRRQSQLRINGSTKTDLYPAPRFSPWYMNASRPALFAVELP